MQYFNNSVRLRVSLEADKMLLEFVLTALSIFYLTSYLLKEISKRKGNEEQGASTKKLSFTQSMPLLLDLLFKGNVPNYELSKKWSDVYGSLFIFVHPFRNFVFANITDLEICKRIMGSTAWVDRLRSDHYLYTGPGALGNEMGIVFGNGGYWKEARKLTMKLLHQLDFYRQENLEKFINFELRDLEEEMLKAVEDGGGRVTMTMHQKFEVYALNIVYQVMLGKRFNRDDPVAKKMIKLINAANREFNVGSSILEIFPWLLRIPFLKILQELKTLNNFLIDYLKRELVDSKRKARTYENPTDFVDYFLLEIDRRAHESPRYLNDENLLASLRDLTLAGTDTTNTALEHGILQLSLNPHIQRKVQDEIDRIIGTRQPRYDDRISMPYTQAVLQEILRFSTPVPIGSRCPLSDNEINGEHIPKGSLVAINFYAIHHHRDLWNNPEVFQPERFLNDNNELINLDKVMPFGWGKRHCVGETVARISLFLFVVRLMQTLTFEISQDHPPPSMKNQIGLSRAPSPYHVVVKRRHH